MCTEEQRRRWNQATKARRDARWLADHPGFTLEDRARAIIAKRRRINRKRGRGGHGRLMILPLLDIRPFRYRGHVMAHRRIEGVNAIAQMVARYPGAKVSFGFTGSTHQVAEIVFGSQRRKVFFSMTPSDCNGHKQAARNARRVLHDLGATPTEI